MKIQNNFNRNDTNKIKERTDKKSELFINNL